MEISQIISLARKHAANGALMQSSAMLCLSDAYQAKNDGNAIYASMRAIKSLAYSVGIFHLDYKAAING